MRRVLPVLLCALLSLHATALVAQVTPGTAATIVGTSISGVVTDPSGAPVPGAVVDVIVSGRRVATMTTGANGRYEVAVPAGAPYRLQVARQGFAEQIVDVAGAMVSATRNLTLRLGGVSDTVVVTASRAAEARSAVTSSVTVVTAEEIAALGSRSLADVLNVVPGLSIAGTGRQGAVTALFSRGGESDYNLVLIDGVRVNQSGGAFDFSRVAAGEIERVEVVRGAQSALYGSDAMGAVVQVFTRRSRAGDAPHVSGSVDGGSFNTWRGNARVTGGAGGRFDYQAGVVSTRTEGAFAERLTEDDRFDQTAVDATAGMSLGTRAMLRTGVRHSRADGRSVGQIGYVPGDSGAAYDTEDTSWHFDVSHSVGSRFAGTGAVTYFRSRSITSDTIADASARVYALLTGTPGALYPNGPRLVRLLDDSEFQYASANLQTLGSDELLGSTTSFDFAPFTSRTDFRRPGLRYQGDYAWADGQRLTGGYEFEQESNPAVDTFKTHNNALFFQQQFTLAEHWSAAVGARSDTRTRYGTYVSPKVSLGGFVIPFRSGSVSSVRVFASAGRGIKSPQFNERFDTAFSDGNPDLKPERARTVEAGAELTLATQRLRASATYFDNDYRDQVVFRSTGRGDGLADFINIDRTKARGWELETAMQRPILGFTAAASYSHVDSEVVSSISTSRYLRAGQPLIRRPKHSGTLRATYALGRAAVNVDARFVGQRHDTSFQTLTIVATPAAPNGGSTDITVNPGYAVAGVGLDVRAHDALTLFLRVDNVGDTHYEPVLGYPGLPRSATVGLRFTIGGRR